MINKVTLIGNVGQDPDIRTLENGTQVGHFSLATNESYKDKAGEWQTQTEWHNVVVWRELADRAAQLKKGVTVYVDGKIQSRKYTDKDGVEKVSFDIVANTFRLLEKKDKVINEVLVTSEPSAPAKQSEEPWQAKPNIGEDLPF